MSKLKIEQEDKMSHVRSADQNSLFFLELSERFGYFRVFCPINYRKIFRVGFVPASTRMFGNFIILGPAKTCILLFSKDE